MVAFLVKVAILFKILYKQQLQRSPKNLARHPYSCQVFTNSARTEVFQSEVGLLAIVEPRTRLP